MSLPSWQIFYLYKKVFSVVRFSSFGQVLLQDSFQRQKFLHYNRYHLPVKIVFDARIGDVLQIVGLRCKSAFIFVLLWKTYSYERAN